MSAASVAAGVGVVYVLVGVFLAWRGWRYVREHDPDNASGYWQAAPLVVVAWPVMLFDISHGRS